MYMCIESSIQGGVGDVFNMDSSNVNITNTTICNHRPKTQNLPSQQTTGETCNTLQHTATHCNTLQHPSINRWRNLQHTAHATTHCKKQKGKPATHCNTLQHTATHWRGNLQHGQITGGRGEKRNLQHTAAHCNTLQQAATHRGGDLQHGWIIGSLREKRNGPFVIFLHTASFIVLHLDFKRDTFGFQKRYGFNNKWCSVKKDHERAVSLGFNKK